MILLKATNETLQMIVTTAANIDFSVSYADITTTSFLPSSNEGSVVAGTQSILAAPAASTQRQTKLITISNRHVSLSNTVVVQKLIASTTYNLTPTVTLLAGETMQYMDGQGWMYYSATGAIKSTQTAAGSNTQVQYSNNGVLSGDAGLTWNSATNSLGVGGTTGQIQLTGVSTLPTIPASGTLEIFSQALSGKMHLMKQGPAGDDEAIQASIWQNNTVLWTPGVAAGVWQGTVSSASTGTVALAIPTTTNIYTSMRRSTFTSVVTTTNQQVGMASEPMFFRGAAAGMGGFFFVCRFGLNAWTAGDRLFIGLTAGMNSTTMADPTTIANTVGFAINAGDTAISFIHVDGTTTATKDAIAGQPVLATNNGYDAYIYARPNETTIFYRLENSLTGALIVEGSTTTTLPSNVAMLYARTAMSNGANTAVGAAGLGVNRIYVETNR